MPCSKEERESEIAKEFRKQIQAISELKDAISTLGEKIAPVLGGGLDSKEKTRPSDLLATPLGKELSGNNDRIFGCIELVVGLIKRVEL